MAYSRSLTSEVTVPGKSCDSDCEVNFLNCYKTCNDSNCLLECSETKNVCQTNCNDEIRPLSERMGSNILIIHRKVFHKKYFLQFFFWIILQKHFESNEGKKPAFFDYNGKKSYFKKWTWESRTGAFRSCGAMVNGKMMIFGGQVGF